MTSIDRRAVLSRHVAGIDDVSTMRMVRVRSPAYRGAYILRSKHRNVSAAPVKQIRSSFPVFPASVLIVLAAASSAAAQDYPNRPVRVIDPFSPGGGSDVLARIATQKLTERLGQSFVVENRPGGGGHIGADTVVKSKPDGYTLLVAGVPHAIGMTLYRKLPYDMAKD